MKMEKYNTTIKVMGKDIEKADVLRALYNSSQPLGLGWLHWIPEEMTKKEAQEIIDTGQTYFDYLKGRVLKIDLGKKYLDFRLYDRDNGKGRALEALSYYLNLF